MDTLSDYKVEWQILMHVILKGKIKNFAKLGRDMFDSTQTKEVFDAISASIASKNRIYDLDVFQSSPNLSQEARYYLSNVKEKTLKKHKFKDMTDVLAKWATLRRMKMGLEKSADILQSANGMDPDDIAKELHTTINEATSFHNRSDWFNFSADNEENDKMAKAQLDGEAIEYIPSLFQVWDKTNVGFEKGSLIVLASNPGGGKSMMASTFAMKWCLEGLNVILIPLEMMPSEMFGRLMASVTGFPLNKLMKKGSMSAKEKKSGYQKWKGWLKKCKKAGGSYWIMDPESTSDVHQLMLRAQVRNPDVIIIDQGPLLEAAQGDQDWKKLGDVSKILKNFSKKTGIITMMLSQLDHSTGELRYGKRIKDDANYMWTWIVGPDEKESGIVSIAQDKCRQGDNRNFNLKADWPTFTFTDVPKAKDLNKKTKTPAKRKAK